MRFRVLFAFVLSFFFSLERERERRRGIIGEKKSGAWIRFLFGRACFRARLNIRVRD